MASGFIGSGTEPSKANQELIAKPAGWSFAPECYQISFYNAEACTVKVNGALIPLRAEQGFETDIDDVKIKSFIIVEEGIEFNFVGAY